MSTRRCRSNSELLFPIEQPSVVRLSGKILAGQYA